MMEVIIMDINKVKQLRQETGLGMLEVKQALEETHDDLDSARQWLKTKIVKQESSTRIASKGLTRVVTDGNQAILFEVNAETDFVSKHPQFIDMMVTLGEHLMRSSAITLSDAKQVLIQGMTVEDYINKVATIIKEHCFIRRFHRIKKQPHQVFYSYMHLGGKLSVLLITDRQSDDIGKKITMQIASHGPKYLSFSELDQNTLDYEMYMLKQEGFAGSEEEKIKHIRQMCLLDQSSLYDPNQRVHQTLNDVKIIDFYRFELGQGIENKLNCRLDIPCDGSTITVTPIF